MYSLALIILLQINFYLSMSWNVDAPEFVPGRRFAPPSLSVSSPYEGSQPSEEIPLSFRTHVTSGEPSSSSRSSATGSMRYSDVTAAALQSSVGDFAEVYSVTVGGL
jgi:hypothetical protein